MSPECLSLKPRHATEQQARNAALTAMRRVPSLQLSYYLCSYCKGWHLTRSVGGANPKLR
jgi:hypothetical protein